MVDGRPGTSGHCPEQKENPVTCVQPADWTWPLEEREKERVPEEETGWREEEKRAGQKAQGRNTTAGM